MKSSPDELKELINKFLCHQNFPFTLTDLNQTLDQELETIFSRLRENVSIGEYVPFEELKLVKLQLQNNVDNCSPEIQHEHLQWKISYGWGKKFGVDLKILPPGKCYPAIELLSQLNNQMRKLEYCILVASSPKSCDCQVRVSLNLPPELDGVNLIFISEGNNGYYFGTILKCKECGIEWFKGMSDDDFGTLFWEVF
jgi:hypothetical protein